MELTHPDDALSTLLGARVLDRDGRRLGRVHDVLAAPDADGAWVLTALVVARGPLRRARREIPWRDVVERREDGVLVVG